MNKEMNINCGKNIWIYFLESSYHFLFYLFSVASILTIFDSIAEPII